MTTEDSTGKATRLLLEWLLEKYPDAPRKRARQWITAGRVSEDDAHLDATATTSSVTVAGASRPLPFGDAAQHGRDARAT